MVRKRLFTASLPPLKMLQAEYAPPHEVRLLSWFFEKWVVLAMEHQAMAFGLSTSWDPIIYRWWADDGHWSPHAGWSYGANNFIPPISGYVWPRGLFMILGLPHCSWGIAPLALCRFKLHLPVGLPLHHGMLGASIKRVFLDGKGGNSNQVSEGGTGTCRNFQRF